jgi:gliding motility-associated-like protein
MKNIYSVLLLLIFCAPSFAQQHLQWITTPFRQEVFIENKGQYDGMNELADPVLFGIDNGFKVYFTSRGLTWRFEHLVPMTPAEKKEFKRTRGYSENEAEDEGEEEDQKLVTNHPVLIHMEWIGANANVQVIAQDVVPEYFCYADPDQPQIAYDHIPGYKKIIYKNLYPHIDVEYIYVRSGGKEGIKYSVIVHPGGDPSLVKMKYTGATPVRDLAGNIYLQNGILDDLTEEAPSTFYAASQAIINSSFVVEGNVISFKLDSWSKQETIVIDPFNVVPSSLALDQKAFDVTRDAAGNVYVAGGINNYKLAKYNSAGTLIWTYSSPYGPTSTYGDHATDPAGNSYFINSFETLVANPTAIVKIDPAGTQLYFVPFFNKEQFHIVYNSCNQQLFMHRYIASGNQIGQLVNVDPATGMQSGAVNTINSEYRSLCAAPNGTIFGLTCNLINTNIGADLVSRTSTFAPTGFGVIPSGCAFPENGVYYSNGITLVPGPPGWAGQNGITADNCFVYTFDGLTINKRNATTGVIVSTAIIQGGVPEFNSGIAVDSCGNIYAGSQAGVYKFDFNLAQTGFVATNFPVYCVAIGINGEVLACGNQFVAAIAFGTCSPVSCLLPTLSFATVNPGCASNNGVATVMVNGSAGPYTYSWSNGGNTATISNLAPGVYTCTVTAACYTIIDTVTLTAPSTVAASVTSITNASCAGDNDGSITVNVSAANGPCTYAWSPAAGNASTANNLFAGTYSCTITDSAGCMSTLTATITEPPAITATSSMTPTTCGNNTGSATITPGGGNAPFSFLWNPSGQTTQTANNLGAGVYTCTITDANGCTQNFQATVTNANGPSLSVLSQQDVSCNGGNDGNATVAASGGAPPYSFAWSPSGGNSASANSLAAGNYVCTITDSAGCTQSIAISLSEPPAFILNFSATPASCGNNNGSASVNVSGASPPYSYQWSSGGNAATENNLAAGTYSCVITDNAGCQADSSVTVVQSSGLVASSMHSNVSCYGGSNGSATALINSGSGPFTYNWLPAGGTNATATNLSAGTYTCTATDPNGCVDTAVAVITEPPALSLALFKNDVVCNGGNSGMAWASVNGGTGAYTFSWLPLSSSNDSIFNCTAGTYTCIITDANGCSEIDSIAITEPQKLEVFAPDSLVLCQGQSITIPANASGGTPAYSLVWNPNGPTVSPASTTIYSVYATDANGCVSLTDSILVIVNPALSINSVNPPPVCAGSTVTLVANAAGGDGNYQYAWSAGTIPASGNTVSATPAASSSYTVIVTDGCGSPADTAILSVVINPLPQPVFTTDQLNGCAPICITYSDATNNSSSCYWQFGDGGFDSSGCVITYCYNQPGTFYPLLTVTDNNGCTGTSTAAYVIDVYPSPSAGFNYSPQDASILDPQISFGDQSQGATQWQWNFGDGVPATSVLQNPVFTFSDTGTFTVQQIVFNAYGCSDTAYADVFIETDATLYIPNAFTPNGDGMNETFYPVGIGADETNYELLIFDRWGNLLFESTTWNEGWDGMYEGKLCQEDVYVWRLTYRSSVQKQVRVYTGHVSLIR